MSGGDPVKKPVKGGIPRPVGVMPEGIAAGIGFSEGRVALFRFLPFREERVRIVFVPAFSGDGVDAEEQVGGQTDQREGEDEEDPE